MTFNQLDDESKISTSDAWRVFRILSEFVSGFEIMANLGPSVSVFGSARLKPESPYYALAVAVAKEISLKGFTIITGGGPGIMEAANKGAQEGKGKSCGVGIDLPQESELNSFIDLKYRLRFRYFFVRKVMFIRYAQGYVFLPGGYGTLDEMFEALTLIQTEKIHPFPIYLLGSAYWKGMLDWIEEILLGQECITKDDFKLIQVTDDPKEVANGIERHFHRHRSLRNF